MLGALGGLGPQLGDAARSWGGVATSAVVHAGGRWRDSATWCGRRRGRPTRQPPASRATSDPPLRGLDVRRAVRHRNGHGTVRRAVGRRVHPRVGPGSAAGWRACRSPSPDRRSLTSARPQGGGRLDRLDLWFIVVLVVASLFLRTFRLAQPYACTSTRSTTPAPPPSSCRTGTTAIPHSVYEYTHPHFAKYAMALGIVLFGDNKVTGTTQLPWACGCRSSRAGRDLRWLLA